jgi:hypothetical protein
MSRKELGPTYQQPVNVTVVKDTETRSLDWPVLVVALALSCTLAWIYFLLWLAVHVAQVLFA